MIASDGYEYESLTHRLLGEPKGNWRNRQLRAYLKSSDLFRPRDVRAWQEAYDKEAARTNSSVYSCDRAGRDAMSNPDPRRT